MAIEMHNGDLWSPDQLLAALSAEDLESLQPHIQRVTMVLEQSIHEPGEVMDHVYFVENGIVSITADTDDNGSVEIGMIGTEEMVGVSAVLNPDVTVIHGAVVRVLRSAIRMRSTALRETLETSRPFNERCLRYA